MGGESTLDRLMRIKREAAEIVPEPSESLSDRFSTILAETAAENERDTFWDELQAHPPARLILVGGDGSEQVENYG